MTHSTPPEPTPPQGSMPPGSWPQQHRTAPGSSPGAPPPVTHAVTPTKGLGPAVAAVVLGVLGCAAPLLPVDLTGVRSFVGLPFGLAGLALALVGLTGHRRGMKPL